MRRTEKEELTNPNVMRIQFEDLVYHYNETTHQINEFLGLDEKKHILKYKYFNPNISDFAKSTFTDSLFDIEIVRNLTVQILKEQNLIDEKALNNFTKKSTILIVSGLFTPFGIGTIASGIAYAVGKSKLENKRRVKAFRYYQNSDLNLV